MLLHGVGESAAGWHPVQEALSHQYDVIALDLPGFGDSARLPANTLPNAAALADAVEHEMDQLGIADFHVAGYSLGARVSLELATRDRIRSVVAIAPDGLGTPLERVFQATALMAGRTVATLLAPVATLVTASGPGRSLFFAMERSRPWKLTRQDARQLLLNFANAPAYEQTVLASAFDSRRLRKSFGCLTALCAVEQTLDFRDSPRDAGYDHSAWQTLLPTPAEREVR